MNFEGFMKASGLDESTENSVSWRFYSELWAFSREQAIDEAIKVAKDGYFCTAVATADNISDKLKQLKE